jgi:hypothetical protein
LQQAQSQAEATRDVLQQEELAFRRVSSSAG